MGSSIQQRHGQITRSLGQGIKVSMDGDWFSVRDAVNRTPVQIAMAAAGAQMAVAQKYKRLIRRNIRSNRFGFKNSPKYAKFKASKGGGGKPLRWTFGYYHAIMITKSRDGKMVQVTVDPNAMYSAGSHGKKGGQSIHIKTVANILEHGSSARGIGAYPVWRMTFKKDMKGKHGIQLFMARSIGQRLSMTLGR